MGLELSVGTLSRALGQSPAAAVTLYEEFGRLNRFLKQRDIPEHQEPETLPALANRAAFISMPYLWMHSLRRAVAYARNPATRFEPAHGMEAVTEDPLVVLERTIVRASHIICHSDCDGYFVPIDFEHPLYADDEASLPGLILGSSVRMHAELVMVAPLLGIRLEGGQLADRDARRLAAEVGEDHPCAIERQTWLTLFELARLSLTYRTAIRFS